MAMEIVVSFPGGACVDAAYGDFVIKTDQPLSDGGEDSAPSPFMLFLASLGTCAGIYVLSFCQNRGLPTDGLRIRQSMEMDPQTHLVPLVKFDIDLPAGFPEKYLGALVKAAQLCTVKRHLENPPHFEIETHIG